MANDNIIPPSPETATALEAEGYETTIPQAPVVDEEVEVEENLYTPELDEAIDEEITYQDEYGDAAAGIQTAVERGLNAGLMSFPDHLAKTFGGKKVTDAMATRARENPYWGGIATGVGIIGPMVLSGGTSALARGAQITGGGVLAASKAGLAVENLTLKGIQKIVGKQYSKKLVGDVLAKGIAKGAGSGVEGFMLGGSQLISENALGDKEFNGENILAYGGHGALWGGLVGGAFGMAPGVIKKGVEVVTPVVKNNRVVRYATKKIKDVGGDAFNKVRRSWKMAGLDDIEIDHIEKSRPGLANNTPTVLRKVAEQENIGVFSRPMKLYRGVEKFREKSFRNIVKTLRQIDDVKQPGGNYLPTKRRVAAQVSKELENLKKEMSDEFGSSLEGSYASKVSAIDDAINTWNDKMIGKGSSKQYSATGLWKSRVQYDKLVPHGQAKLTAAQAIDQRIAKAFRDELDLVSKGAPAELGQGLKKHLLDYGTAASYNNALSKHIKAKSGRLWGDLQGGFLGAMAAEMVHLGGAVGMGLFLRATAKSDFYNRMVVFSGMEKANQSIGKGLLKGTKDFLAKSNFKDAIVPVSTKMFLESPLTFKEGKKAKNENEAIDNMIEKLDTVKAEPLAISEASSNPVMSVYAPDTFTHMQSSAAKALLFLDSKMPRFTDVNPFTNKKFKPTTQELYKIKKYLYAIENPMKVFKEFSKGNISRESVEAISFVYPNLYNRMRVEVMQELQANPDSIDYKQRLLLGTLLDMPTDLALKPEAISALQQYYSESAESKTGGYPGGNKVPITAARDMKMASSMATELEKVQNPSAFK
tara:strand:+ start:358 stop:2805 length:2448 start_codon:yes stop_codon:yes gene_type:complete